MQATTFEAVYIFASRLRRAWRHSCQPSSPWAFWLRSGAELPRKVCCCSFYSSFFIAFSTAVIMAFMKHSIKAFILSIWRHSRCFTASKCSACSTRRSSVVSWCVSCDSKHFCLNARQGASMLSIKQPSAFKELSVLIAPPFMRRLFGPRVVTSI